MTSRRRALLLQAAAGGGPAFFGSYSMLREFWAEDPDWTNPGNGNLLSTVRDNGTSGANLSSATNGGGLGPIYSSALIGGKPGFDFRASSPTVGGYLWTASGASGTDITIGCVARFDNGNANAEYAIDGRSSANDRAIIGALTGSSGWRGYSSSSLAVAAGTVDTNPHLFVYRAATNDAELWVDGVSVGTDTSGSFASFNGITLGANTAGSNQILNGAVCYAFMFAGDLTAQAGFAAWQTNIMTHYGI